MSFNYENNVSKKGITRQEFEQQLNSKLEKLGDKKQEKYKQKAMDIFTRFAGLNGDANTLDEAEQIQARAAFEALDRNENGKISRRDIRKGGKGSETQQIFADNGYKASKFFMDTFDSIIDASDNSGEVQYGKENNTGNSQVTVHYTQNTEEVKDDGLTTYHLDGEHRIVQKDDILENQTNVYEGDEQNPYVVDDTVDRVTTGLPPEEKVTPLVEPSAPKPLTESNIKSGFFQYLTQDKNFTGIMINGEMIQLPQGCEVVNDGIKFDGKLYKMRGDFDTPDDILRFECDETKETLRQALAKRDSDDSTHRYHNHGDKVNEQSTYNAQTGTISHGNDESAVSQTQTFASMLMNNAENSTLTLDKQSGTKETTGETILNTINTDNDDGITMQELISYLNAAQKESKTVKSAGARKFASGVDLDAKDLANIGQVFKKYAGSDGKLQKAELQNLLNDLKKTSMTKLAAGNNDKYIGTKENNDDAPTIPTVPNPTPDKDKVVLRDGNRERKVKDNNNEKGYGDNQEYYYNKGKRTALEEREVDSVANPQEKVKITVEDNNGNIAQAGHSSLFKKRFVYMQDLEKEVNAKVQERTVDGKENQQIVKVKDKNNEITYYAINTLEDGSYKLGEKLIEKPVYGKNTYVTETRFRKEVINILELTDDIKIPKNITAEYDKDGKLKFKLNGGDCSLNTAKVYIIRHNTQIGKNIPEELQKIDLKKQEENKDEPVKLSDIDKKYVEERAKELGLRKTNGSDYGWYYSEKEYLHYLWDNEIKEFIPKKGVSLIDEHGKDIMKRK